MTEIKKVYNQDWTPKYIHYVAVVLMMSMLANQFTALKFIDVFGFSMIASYLTYPISLVVCDVLSEVYGFRRTRKLLYVCMALYALNVALVQMVIHLPPAADYQNNEMFSSLFGQLPRIVFAGILGYATGELLNSYVMSRVKHWTDGKHFFFRALFSTGISQILNCIIFFGIGFWGIMPVSAILENVAIGVFIILGYEALVLPLTMQICKWLKAKEGVDHFDLPKKSA